MRVSFCLIAVVAVLLARVDAVSDGGHPALSATTSVDPVAVVHGNSAAKRFLRTRETFEDEEAESEDDDDTEDEERGIQDLIRKVSFKQLDDVAGDLVSVPGAVKYLNGQNDELLKTIAAKKWTPQSMKDQLGIAAKKATATKDQLKSDPDYLLYRAFKKFWNERRATA
ncbi:hypothetical protein PHYBOEH_008179 [Phytophthora boehmeriae]|uniref:RxLR effector protein n=1 Tax=Phytophthora boehmeriae TaxID=109152 RepID=A0A8T1W2G7_9STRA|nr:hypothetical protein PHYBOEH_008179 [Phytophthora boehmeriae]